MKFLCWILNKRSLLQFQIFEVSRSRKRRNWKISWKQSRQNLKTFVTTRTWKILFNPVEFLKKKEGAATTIYQSQIIEERRATAAENGVQEKSRENRGGKITRTATSATAALRRAARLLI